MRLSKKFQSALLSGRFTHCHEKIHCPAPLTISCHSFRRPDFDELHQRPGIRTSQRASRRCPVQSARSLQVWQAHSRREEVSASSRVGRRKGWGRVGVCLTRAKGAGEERSSGRCGRVELAFHRMALAPALSDPLSGSVVRLGVFARLVLSERIFHFVRSRLCFPVPSHQTVRAW